MLGRPNPADVEGRPSPRVFEYKFDTLGVEVMGVTPETEVGREASVMHVRCPERVPEDVYRQVLEQMAELSSVVQALPPSAALAELRGALRYHGVDAVRLAEVLRVRTVSRLGVDVRVGIGPSISVAATASGRVPAPGGVLAVPADRVTEWLAPLPVEALHGIGPRQAQALRDYGVHTVGLLAAIPPATAQRLLGGRPGRQAADRARGVDPRPVVPRALPATASVRRDFTRQALDGAGVRAALLDLVVALALRLRRAGQAARGLTLTLRFAGGTAWERTRRLAEASAHEDDLRTLAYRLMDAAGLQRGRITAITLKADDLVEASRVAEQISLDAVRESRLVAEAAVDRIRARFGPDAVRPAATFLRVS